jgi:ankyrin repeat protein
MAAAVFGVPGRGPLRRMRSATSLVAMRQQDNAPTDLALMISFYQVAWRVVRHRLARPFGVYEAHQHDEHGCTVLYNALSRRVDDYPPLDVVQSLIRAYPEAVRMDNSGRSPLEAACQRGASLDILQALMDVRPAVPQDHKAFIAFWNSYSELMGGELVEFLREGGREAASVLFRLESLLMYCCQKSSTLLSLHAAASLPMCPAGAMEALLFLNPKIVHYTDEEGRLPLHHAASIGKKEFAEPVNDDNHLPYTQRIRILLETDLSTSQRKDKKGFLPLHMAASSGLPTPGLKLFVEAWPDALFQRHDGLFPAFLAAECAQSTLDEVYFLLLAAPDVLNSL